MAPPVLNEQFIRNGLVLFENTTGADAQKRVVVWLRLTRGVCGRACPRPRTTPSRLLHVWPGSSRLMENSYVDLQLEAE